MLDLLDRLTAALSGCYAIQRELGQGGMSTVYLAQDLKHHRPVALKVLRPDLAAALGPERFLREIELTARLTHPHILPVHDSGSTDGFLYYVMPYVEGESLRDRLDREKQLPVDDALRISLEVADGLSYAHEHGVIHRDIKPENILLESGHAVLADFGVAHALDHASGRRITQAGMAVGTPAYMSPEQITGCSNLDGRADVYALGCVLYELLAGQAPFTGPTAEIIARQHLLEEPPDVTRLRPSVSPAVARVLKRALSKLPADRFASSQAFLDALRSVPPTTSAAAELVPIQPGDAPSPSLEMARKGRRRWILAVGLVLVSASVALPLMRTARAVWARSYGIAALQDYVAAGDWEPAHQLAARLAAAIPRNERLAAIRNVFSDTIAIEGDPAGARVYRRPYGGADEEWTYVGIAPIEALVIPRLPAVSEFRVEADGYGTAHDVAGAAPQGRGMRPTIRYTLLPEGRTPPDMVWVPGATVSTGNIAQLQVVQAQIADFWLNRHEVPNRDYQEFVDAGGYRTRGFWQHEFVDGGRRLSFEAAMARFVDRTGRAGPATWEAGRFPQGQDDHPVAGVSWYEAAAYAQFRGRRLPNVFEWLHAVRLGAVGAIISASNIGNVSDRTAPIGFFRGMSGWGVMDMAGNVREWCYNESRSTGGRYIMGGSWAEPTYSFLSNATTPPMDRSPSNGIRLALSISDQPGDSRATGAVEPRSREYAHEKPVPDELFRIYEGLFAYDLLPLHEQVELRDSTDQWVTEKVSFGAAYGGERMAAYLYLPVRGRSPYQVVVYFPGAGALPVRSSAQLLAPPGYVDFLVQNGRAVILPILSGTYERGNGRLASDPDESNAYREWVIHLRQDVSRAIDYLGTRADIDTSAIGYLGLSWGGRMGGIVLATERRFKAAVLAVAGLNAARALPEVDDVNYVPRVTIPVLMLNGRYDSTFPLESYVVPMYELLGTPSEHKANVVVDGAHFVPRHALIRETLAWFDRYLGPVK